MRHAGADHPRRLGDVDCGDPFHDLFVVVDLDLLAYWHRPSSLRIGMGRKWAARGLGWEPRL
jgi:hypothetical protein